MFLAIEGALQFSILLDCQSSSSSAAKQEQGVKAVLTRVSLQHN